MIEGLWALWADPIAIFWMLVAVPIGMVFGAVPGLGGKIALIAVMPFIIGMDTLHGAVFLISLHAVVHTGGAAPTILLGIPGTGPSTAVVMDGHAMTRKGDGARAITAAAVASGIGGVIGTIVLAAIVPFALGMMQLISYPEIFLLTLFGLSFSALLSGDSMTKGLAVGCFGLVVAFVGQHHVFGTARMTMGTELFQDGVHLVAAVLALYAVPEMLAVGSNNKDSRVVFSQTASGEQSDQVRKGFSDIVRHRWLTLRSSVFGAIVGIIPGLGGDVAAWLCYGHAAQTSKQPEMFGKGAVEGVIGPEAANNSKEGGSLVPTLFLGIPGSSGMAILLIALVPIGISPGPGFIQFHGDLIWAMVWALAISNIAAAAMLILMAKGLRRLSGIRSEILVPYVFLLAMASIYISTNDWGFFLVLAVFAAFGYALKRFDWPRAPFVIGLILGPETEQALVKALGLWGPGFLLRPGSLLLMAVLMFSLLHLSRRLMSRAKVAKIGEHDAR